MNAQVAVLELGSIIESNTNPNGRAKGADFDALVESVREHGVLSPVLVRPKDGPKGIAYELVAGHRRFAAAKKAGLSAIPAHVRELSDTEALELQVVENLHRADLHPLDEALLYVQLLRVNYTTAKIAERIGRSVQYVYDRLRLLKLTKPAQKLFREGRFSAAHAVLLSRCPEAMQERALDLEASDMPLFTHESVELFVEDGDTNNDPYFGLKTRSVRELQAWIDDHVRLDPNSNDVPDLFPETAKALDAAAERGTKVVEITREFQIADTAKDGAKVLGPRAWKLADEKSCDHVVTGVVVVGAGRGHALPVCTEKTCKVHWAAEIRERKLREKEKLARATGDEKGAGSAKSKADAAEKKRKEAEAESQQLMDRWSRAQGAIAKAFAEHIADLPAGPKSALAKLVIEESARETFGVSKEALALVPVGDSAEDVLRHCAYRIVLPDLFSSYRGPESAREIKRRLDFDALEVLDRVVPAEPKAAKPAKAAAKKRGAK